MIWLILSIFQNPFGVYTARNSNSLFGSWCHFVIVLLGSLKVITLSGTYCNGEFQRIVKHRSISTEKWWYMLRHYFRAACLLWARGKFFNGSLLVHLPLERNSKFHDVKEKNVENAFFFFLFFLVLHLRTNFVSWCSALNWSKKFSSWKKL